MNKICGISRIIKNFKNNIKRNYVSNQTRNQIKGFSKPNVKHSIFSKQPSLSIIKQISEQNYEIIYIIPNIRFFKIARISSYGFLGAGAYLAYKNFITAKDTIIEKNKGENLLKQVVPVIGLLLFLQVMVMTRKIVLYIFTHNQDVVFVTYGPLRPLKEVSFRVSMNKEGIIKKCPDSVYYTLYNGKKVVIEPNCFIEIKNFYKLLS